MIDRLPNSRFSRHALPGLWSNSLVNVVWWALFLSAFFAVATAEAVVVGSGDGSGNTTAPADDPGFANVGVRGVASAIYLGNRWVLTAAHVGANSVELAGQEYGILAGETRRLTNPGTDESTDLILFRLNDSPELPSLRLPCEAPRLGTDLVMIGKGHDRQPEPTFWSVSDGSSGNDAVWTVVSDPDDADRRGFLTVENQTIRWGAGSVGLVDLIQETPQGDVLSFASSFAESLDIEFLSQAVRGDSGGAVFQKNRGVWELMGVMFAVDLLENQPAGTRSAVFGNTTLIADLFRYRETIRAIADFEPDPADLDGDGQYSADEIDQLALSSDLGVFGSCHLDVNQDGVVSDLDFDALIALPEILTGDSNLDGSVGFADFLQLGGNFGKQSQGWADGDFTGDQVVDFADFLVLSGQFGKNLDTTAGGRAAAASVPEPNFGVLTWLGVYLLLRWRPDR